MVDADRGIYLRNIAGGFYDNVNGFYLPGIKLREGTHTETEVGCLGWDLLVENFVITGVSCLSNDKEQHYIFIKNKKI